MDMDPVDLDNTIITMQTDSKDESKGKFQSGHSKADAVFTKIKEILQDKRDTFEDDRNLPITSDARSIPIVKRTLNITFLAIGIVLLVGVLVVIIYTSIGRAGSRPGDKPYEEANKLARKNHKPVQNPAPENVDSSKESYHMVPSIESQTEPAQPQTDDNIRHYAHEEEEAYYKQINDKSKTLVRQDDLPDINAEVDDGNDLGVHYRQYHISEKQPYEKNPSEYEQETNYW